MGLTTAKNRSRHKDGSSIHKTQALKQPPGLAARSQAALALSAIIDDRRMLDSALPPATQTSHTGHHDSADRALTRALVLTALRHLPTLDSAIQTCLDAPLPATARHVTAILRIMAAQLLLMDMPAHAAVGLAVEDAARTQQTRTFKGLINALGRRMVRDKAVLLEQAPSINLPTWLQERWKQAYGRKQLAQIGTVLQNQPPIDLTLKPDVDRTALIHALAPHQPVLLTNHSIRLYQPGAIERLPGYEDGLWWVQDIAASLPAVLLAKGLDNPGTASVLDLCAAPGGKTAQLASANMQVTAVDQSEHRMKRLTANMERLKLDVETYVGDALSYPTDTPFDAVLLDAPCSATGTLRRNPDIAYIRTQDDIESLVSLQQQMLDKAADLVRPTGIMVYATCSMEPEEGESQILTFLERHPNWSLDAIDTDGMPPKSVRKQGWLRTLPCFSAHPEMDNVQHTGMDGFFAARLRKNR